MSVLEETPGRSRRPFTDEFKRDAVALVLDEASRGRNGACYRALRRLFGRHSHPLVSSSFQDPTWAKRRTSGRRRVRCRRTAQ